MLHMTDLIQRQADLTLARQIAEQAGQYIASRWDTTLKITHKGRIDLVSEVDLQSEQMIISALQKARPHDVICAEESNQLASHTTSQERTWYIDPLDGTTNFSHGVPHFCTSIALWDQGQAQVAVIYHPVHAWSFYAIRGQGAWFNGTPMQVSQTTDMHKALLATGFPYDRHHSDDENLAQFNHMLKKCQGIRRAGAAALDLAYVAKGWLDGYWEYKLQPWDMGAGILLVQEAGGMISDDLQNQDWFQRRSVVCAGHESLYHTMHTLLNEVRDVS